MMARGAVRKAVRCGAVVSVSAVAGGWKVGTAENKDTKSKNFQNSKSERQQKEDRGQDCVSHNYNN
jgi:hypothetical protein